MQPSTLSSQQQLSAQQQTQQQQDDLFSSSVPSSAGNFRFGAQNAVGQASQSSNHADEFPPLNRNANGEIGQDRNSSLAQGFAFGSSNGLSPTSQPPPNRSNGLLDALSSTSRTIPGNGVASPTSLSGNGLQQEYFD